MTAKEDVDLDKPLPAYGLDSLVAVEMRSWITNEMACEHAGFGVHRRFIACRTRPGSSSVRLRFVDVGAMSASATEWRVWILSCHFEMLVWEDGGRMNMGWASGKGKRPDFLPSC